MEFLAPRGTEWDAPLEGAPFSQPPVPGPEVLDLRLEAADRGRIDAVLARHPGPPGEVFGLEREPGGRHAAIMKTDLNRIGEDGSPS